MQRPGSRGGLHLSAFGVASAALWLVTALVLGGLCLRFAMRLVGVRNDIPVPGLLYAATAPLVQPFGRFAPLPARFDLRAFEAASLLAVLGVLAVALAIYAIMLLAEHHAEVRGISRPPA